MDGSIEVSVHVEPGLHVPVDPERLTVLLERVLRAESVEHAEISVAFVEDETIAQLNREYLLHEGPTDVISFPLEVPGGRVVGDVYVGAEQARRQAEEFAVPLDEELVRLAIHGTLHVIGYDHPEDDDRAGSAMYRRQESLLQELFGSGGPS